MKRGQIELEIHSTYDNLCHMLRDIERESWEDYDLIGEVTTIENQHIIYFSIAIFSFWRSLLGLIFDTSNLVQNGNCIVKQIMLSVGSWIDPKWI